MACRRSQVAVAVAVIRNTRHRRTVLRQRTGYGNGGDDPNSHSSYCGQSFRCGQSFDRAAAIEVASGHATHVAVATAAHMTHVAHSAAANAAVVATHSTAAKVKPASPPPPPPPPMPPPPPLFTSWSMLVEDLRSKVGLAFTGSCVAANRATPLARAVIVIAYRI